ncbi:peptidase M23 [Nonlabens spongiae]|uniref:Peptidase M23 n=1 Tax=Nonlabens spongiae TaxID=331648 RepID=A0A1W6MI95_9FLAO|nr:M23 family metallopeptidase [Nonlabens spongiae]ARN77321.1 peptidase M23 [Nonlabens spongiae]
MIRSSYLLIILSFLSFRYSESQNNIIIDDYFINPLEIDLKLSGNFGELRSNHFHSGLDIKTNQRTGARVVAVANGYVSRIKIERYGYGKALYITHPNGYTSVYGHLEKFAPRIEKYVKNKQYVKESYEIQLFPGDLELRIDQGELIAYSGNSGGSGGPHLHFEIRDSAARPMNPMMMGIEIADTKKPLVRNGMVYPIDRNAIINGENKPMPVRLVQQSDGTFKAPSFRAHGNIGIGINTVDQQNGSNNKNGVFKISTYLNGSKNFEIEFDKYTFAESKRLNQLIDYGFFKKNKSRIMRLYIPDNSPLSLYQNTVNDGVLQLVQPEMNHHFKAEIMDFKGNTSEVVFNIENDYPPNELVVEDESDLTYIHKGTTFREQYGNFHLTIPSGALYDDELLAIQQHLDTLKVHEDEIPLHKNIIIEYNLDSKQGDNLDQYFIGSVASWGKVYPIKTSRKGNRLRASSRYFGTFAVSKDTDVPSITPINFRDKQWISKNQTLKIKIDDATSGVDGYRATVNGKFILMEYDYKTDLLVYDFDDGVVNEKENHLKLIVTDEVGNSNTFEAVFYRKPLNP